MKKLVSVTLAVMMALVFGISGVYAEDQAQKQTTWSCPRMAQAGGPQQAQGAQYGNCPRMSGRCPMQVQQQNTTSEPGASKPEAGKTEVKGR